MADRKEDRHKSSRNFQSGAQKRKESCEKEKNFGKVLAKTPKIDSFFSIPGKTNTPLRSSSGVLPSALENSGDHGDFSTSTVFPDSAVHNSSPTSSNTGTVPEDLLLESDTAKEAADEQKENTSSESIESTKLLKNENYQNDVGLWTGSFTNDEIEFWIRKKSTNIQHCDEQVFLESSFTQERQDISTIRKCTKSLFLRILQNKELVNRSWLCFSPSTGKIYCYICKLMGVSQKTQFESGFCDWKNASRCVASHEASKSHIESIMSFSQRSNEISRIDQQLSRQVQEATLYWRQVLMRVVSTIKFLAERGLAFRGDDEIINSPNNGNYLGILELISRYDPFLAKHLTKHGNKGRGHINYLSSTICEELIEIMAKEVLTEICTRMKKAKYFSVSVDSTPDEGHIDQLTVITRYMEEISPVERFLLLIPNCGHAGQEMTTALVKCFEDLEIEIKNCRNQSYDNAPNMSGMYKGMQALILKLNPYAIFVPCCAHSLNLVGKTAATTCSSAVHFFDFIQQLFVFFTASTSRYKILNELLHTAEKVYSVKNLSATRWSCNYEAVRALNYGYHEIHEALTAITIDENQKAIVKNEAIGLIRKMDRLETAVYTKIWHDILERFDKTSRYLQSSTMVLNTAVKALKSLKSFVESKRNSFETYENEAKQLAKTENYDTNSRVQKPSVRLQPIGEKKTSRVSLSPRDKFRVEAFLPVVDSLTTSLSKRITAYEVVYERFGFFDDLQTITIEEVNAKAKNLVDCYPEDVESTLGNELVQIAGLARLYERKIEESGAKFLYRIIMENNLRSTFVNAEVVLRIYLSMMVSNCSGERSFSKMKLIKNRLRTTMGQKRLTSLMILSTEIDIVRDLSFENVIEVFASMKSRKTSII